MTIRSRFAIFRPVWAGAILGLLISLGLLTQPLEADAKKTLIAGLFLTYLSIGVLVALVPLWGPRLLFGLLLGLGYSLPGAVFTVVPYPLEANAPAIWREFAGGGWYTFLTTLTVGAVVGMICAWFKPLPVLSPALQPKAGRQSMSPDYPFEKDVPEEKPERETETLVDTSERKPLHGSGNEEEQVPTKSLPSKGRNPDGD